MKSTLYYKNAARAVYKPDLDKHPSQTDQASARETDINVIVGRYGISGQVPGMSGHPMYADFTNLPDDLRTMIETSRSMERLRQELPAALREKPLEELLMLTPDELSNILTPPAPAGVTAGQPATGEPK